MNWHLINIQETTDLLGTRPNGLTDEEVDERLKKYGPNKLAEKKKKPAWLILLSQFKDVMILILLAAAVISGLVGDVKDTVVILIIVVLNAVVGFVQEFRAEKAMEALKKMTASHAKVVRHGTQRQIPAEQLVYGDVVVLEAGDMVPADIRLTEVHSFKIEEASLTGESYAVEKSIGELQNENTPLGDRVNMAYKTTLATYGRGTGFVVATGMNTEIGSIAQLLQEDEVQTPLQKRMADFSKKLSLVVLAMCAVLFGVGYLRGEEPLKLLLTVISVAVAAIPEALPAVITIALSLGAQKLVRKNALIRRLPAVETLGSVTYVCTDKTGTLTLNKMTVQEIWVEKDNPAEAFGLPTSELLLLCMAANQDTYVNQAGEISGDPTEVALAQFARQHEHFQAAWENDFPRIHEFPFDSDRKMMTTVHRTPEGNFLAVAKGALESILQRSEGEDEKHILEQSETFAADGLRVLAYAYKILENDPSKMQQEEVESQLRFCGMAGLLDPPRPEAKQAVAECIAAGIVPVMITGDHPATAKNIAAEIGILREDDDRIVTGAELEKMPPKEFEKTVERIKVYARVSPRQKLDIVKALQRSKHFVAMTGDGVNDAPALRRADIGIAMGITGSDVSKEAAHMILLDDNFATIVKAVREGRRIYDNIRKFVRYIMTGNSGEIWTILLAPLVGLPIPLLPIHILWVNLVTDGLPALALAGEPAEKDIMQRPPRPPGERIFAQGLGLHILWVGLLMGALCLGVQAWAASTNHPAWQTMVFTTLCFCQMAHVLAIRSERFFLFRQGIFKNLPLAGAVLLTFLLQLALIYLPFLQPIFSTKPLTIKELLICIAAAAVVFHAVELEKLVRSRMRKVD